MIFRELREESCSSSWIGLVKLACTIIICRPLEVRRRSALCRVRYLGYRILLGDLDCSQSKAHAEFRMRPAVCLNVHWSCGITISNGPKCDSNGIILNDLGKPGLSEIALTLEKTHKMDTTVTF